MRIRTIFGSEEYKLKFEENLHPSFVNRTPDIETVGGSHPRCASPEYPPDDRNREKSEPLEIAVVANCEMRNVKCDRVTKSEF